MKYTTALTRKKRRDGWTGEQQEGKAKEDSGVKSDDTTTGCGGGVVVVVAVVVVDVDVSKCIDWWQKTTTMRLWVME